MTPTFKQPASSAESGIIINDGSFTLPQDLRQISLIVTAVKERYLAISPKSPDFQLIQKQLEGVTEGKSSRLSFDEYKINVTVQAPGVEEPVRVVAFDLVPIRGAIVVKRAFGQGNEKIFEHE